MSKLAHDADAYAGALAKMRAIKRRLAAVRSRTPTREVSIASAVSLANAWRSWDAKALGPIELAIGALAAKERLDMRFSEFDQTTQHAFMRVLVRYATGLSAKRSAEMAKVIVMLLPIAKEDRKRSLQKAGGFDAATRLSSIPPKKAA